MIGQALDREQAREILREQAERVRVLEMAKRVHLALRIAGMTRQQRRKFASPGIPIGLLEQDARVEELVQQHRMPGEIVRRPGRCARQLGEPRQHGRMLGQQRKVGAAPAHRFEEGQEAPEDCLRVGGVDPGGGGDGEKLGHQRVHALPRQRRELHVAAPGAHARKLLAESCGLGEPERGEHFVRRLCGEVAAPESGERLAIDATGRPG